MILLLVSPRQRPCDLRAVLGDRAGDCLVVTTHAQRQAWRGARHVEVVGEYTTDSLVAAGLWLARRHAVTRVVSFAEADVLAAALLRRALDVPGQDPLSAEAYRDKATMRLRMDAAGIPGPRWAPVDGRGDVLDFVSRAGLPVVVKPRRASGSTGVWILHEAGQLADLPPALPGHLVEEFVRGEAVHVNGLMVAGEPVFAQAAAYTDLGCLSHLHDRGNGSYLLPASDPRHARLEAALWEVVGALPAAADLLLHAEFFLRDGEQPVLCEIASRLPGHPIPPLMDRALGLSLRDLWIRLQAGEPVDRPDLRRRAAQAGPVASYGLPPRRGRLLELPGAVPAGWEGWVHDVLPLAAAGDVWDEQRYAARKSGDFVVTWTVTAPDLAQLLARVQESARWFEERVVYGEPLGVPV